MVRTIATVALLMVLFAPALAFADDEPSCLTKEEQRAAIAHVQAVTLATAIRTVRGSVRGRGGREVVKARLCREAGHLVYVLTVLARDGKVTRTSVDAASGKIVEVR